MRLIKLARGWFKILFNGHTISRSSGTHLSIRFYCSQKMPPKKKVEKKKAQFVVPNSSQQSFFKKGVLVSWHNRAKNVLVSIKDQQQCNSCIAFSTTGVLAAVYLIEHPDEEIIPELSTQHLVDCATKEGKEDKKLCRHSNFKQAYHFMKRYGVYEESVYGKYNGRRGACRNPKGRRLFIRDYINISPKDDVIEKLEGRPLSAAIVLTKEFASHSGEGIYVPPEGTKSSFKNEDEAKDVTLHAVMVISYGVEPDGRHFFIIQNSWGTEWGFNGCAKVDNRSLHFFHYPVGTEFRG